HLLPGSARQLLRDGHADRARIGHVLFRIAGWANRRIERRRILHATQDALRRIGHRAADTTQLAKIVRIVGRRIETQSANLLALAIHGAVWTPRLALAASVQRGPFGTALNAGLLLVGRTTEIRRPRWHTTAVSIEPAKARQPAGQHPATAQ